MGSLAASPPPAVPVVFVDGDQTVDLGTVQPSLAVRKLQAVVADRVGLAPHQISASLARPRRARRVPLDEGADLAAAVAREGPGCYVLAVLRRTRRERRGGRSRRERKAAAAAEDVVVAAPSAALPPPTPAERRTILKRLQPTDLASLVMSSAAATTPATAVFGAWDYDAQLRELQRQREWYLVRTAAADPYAAALTEESPLWSPRRQGTPSPCPECEAAAAAGIREAAFHWCVRDPVTVAFRSRVGPIERPAKKSPSPSPSPSPPPPPPAAGPGVLPTLVGMMPVY